jgi:hypothetical protein
MIRRASIIGLSSVAALYYAHSLVNADSIKFNDNTRAHEDAKAIQRKRFMGKHSGLAYRALDKTEKIVQSFKPLKSIHMHLSGLHVYAAEPGRQVIAHHFCSHLNDDISQCVIYDSDEQNARLIGIEYVITERLFKELPEEEKKLWHSHVCEVKSGMLVAPGTPEAAEDLIMKELVKTYGKTIHTWQHDKYFNVPLGTPQMMYSCTDPDQLDPTLLKKRDEEDGVDTNKKRARRKLISFEEQARDRSADQWARTGKCIVLEGVEKLVKA